MFSWSWTRDAVGFRSNRWGSLVQKSSRIAPSLRSGPSFPSGLLGTGKKFTQSDKRLSSPSQTWRKRRAWSQVGLVGLPSYCVCCSSTLALFSSATALPSVGHPIAGHNAGSSDCSALIVGRGRRRFGARRLRVGGLAYFAESRVNANLPASDAHDSAVAHSSQNSGHAETQADGSEGVGQVEIPLNGANELIREIGVPEWMIRTELRDRTQWTLKWRNDDRILNELPSS